MMGYCDSLLQFLGDWFGAEPITWNAPFAGLKHELPENYCIAVFPPGHRHDFWAYCTVGMSHGMQDKSQIELLLYSPRQDDGLVRILLAASCHHLFGEPLGMHHTVNFGIPWLHGSACMHGYIHLPYLDGPKLELFGCEHGHAHVLWLVPVTQVEKDFAVDRGCEALEERFEQRAFNYLDPLRPAVVP